MDKKLGKKLQLNPDETVQLALEALQQALAVDLRSEEVEVLMVTKAAQEVTKLSNAVVDAHLTAIAERD